MLRALSLVLKFLLELAAFTAFAYWGASVGSSVISVVLAIAAPAIAIVLWGFLAAPRSKRRLATPARIPFELSVFGLAIVALFVAGARIAAIVLAVLVATSSALLARFEQSKAEPTGQRSPSPCANSSARRRLGVPPAREQARTPRSFIDT